MKDEHFKEKDLKVKNMHCKNTCISQTYHLNKQDINDLKQEG